MGTRTTYHQRYYAEHREEFREYQRRDYAKHKGKRLARTRRNRERQRDILFRYKRLKGCADCGIRDIRVLQFDHRPDRGAKAFGLAAGRTRGWGRVKVEVAKCDVVCANCHSIRTWQARHE